MDALTINFAPVLQITDEQFFQLCQINELIRFERNADGTLLLMPLVGGLTSNRNANLTAQLGLWNRDQSLGIASFLRFYRRPYLSCGTLRYSLFYNKRSLKFHAYNVFAL
ncbi:MAG: Uma2 family endonuclease [Nostoc sp.]|uniref:Uma2 family endonuclease n=1 Tax=Nostoc sp. TaxID=1180 RepID=UPI002FF552F6